MCREILNSCVRNTEEAERASKGQAGEVAGATSSGRGLRKGIWGMIEESELAKSIKLKEEKKVRLLAFSFAILCCVFLYADSFWEQNESDVVLRAWTCVTELSSSLAADVKGSPQTPKPVANPAAFNELVSKSKAVAAELAIVIQETEDSSRLEELLGINDQLLSLLKNVPGGTRPQLTLKGLGLTLNDLRNSSVDGDGMLDGLPHINGRAATAINGHRGGGSSASSSADSFEEGGATTPTTPRIDKGKQRAEPEPEQELVLSPKTFQINESESEDEDGVRYHAEEVASPTNR